MIFLSAVVLILLVSIIAVARDFAGGPSAARKSSHSRLIQIGIMVAPILIGVPVLIQVLAFGLRNTGGQEYEWAYHAWRWIGHPVWYVGAASIVALIAFSVGLYRQWKDPAKGLLGVGTNAIGILLGIYFGLVVIVEIAITAPLGPYPIVFYDSPSPRFKPYLSDVKCSDGQVMLASVNLANKEASVPIGYRCLNRIALLRESSSYSRHMAPWPDYTEGYSTQLGPAFFRYADSEVKALNNRRAQARQQRQSTPP